MEWHGLTVDDVCAFASDHVCVADQEEYVELYDLTVGDVCVSVSGHVCPRGCGMI